MFISNKIDLARC